MIGFRDFELELVNLINTHGVDNALRTPDIILARHVMLCLDNYEQTNHLREKWFGRLPADAVPPSSAEGRTQKEV